MKVSELMASHPVPETYTGILSVDDVVIAINTNPTAEMAVDPNDYDVLQLGLTGQPMNLNPEEVTRQFVRGGKQTTVTAKQLSIDLSGTRYIGDKAQDFLMDDSRIFAVGQDAVTDFVYFNLKTGKGFKGKCSISVGSANEGSAGDDATFSCSLKSTEVAPAPWTYVEAP